MLESIDAAFKAFLLLNYPCL